LATLDRFPYVEGMPVIVNQNKYLELKVANGSKFTAVVIVPDPNVQEHAVDEGLSIFFGSQPCDPSYSRIAFFSEREA
jgi:hypothetical protein